MFKNRKLIYFIGFLFVSISLLTIHSIYKSKHYKRDIKVLLDKFYYLKHKNIKSAEKALLLVLKQEPNNVIALKELSTLYLDQKDYKKARTYIVKLKKLLPEANKYNEILYLIDNNKNITQKIALQAVTHVNNLQTKDNLYSRTAPDKDINEAPRDSRAQIKTALIPRVTYLQQNIVKEEQMLNEYFRYNAKNDPRALQVIDKITKCYPKNVLALQEAGYTAIRQGEYKKAINYLEKAQAINSTCNSLMQLAYLYDKIDEKRKAYNYFKKAAKLHKQECDDTANKAMTNLSGFQTKYLDPPYFGELYATPFTQSRFGLTVIPLIARMGTQANDSLQTKKYAVYRITKDNKSKNLGELSQIYEDNVSIIGGGIQISPKKLFPFSMFIEAGAAYDLIEQNRDRWRFDLRSSIIYYNQFGALPRYTATMTSSLSYYSFVYGSVEYFSRYNNNVIATFLTHQGIRLFEYHNTVLNLYVTGRLIEDTNRYFFNNFAEVGPGISLVPSNKINAQLRFEFINGMYLPAGGKYINPYSKYYSNRMGLFFLYLRI